MKIYQATIYQLNEALAVANDTKDDSAQAVLTMAINLLGKRLETEENSPTMELS